MQRSTVLSIAMCICLAAPLGSRAIADQIASETPSNPQDTNVPRGDVQLKGRTPAQVRQRLRQETNSALVGVLLGTSEADGSDLFKISQLFSALEKNNPHQTPAVMA